MWPFGEECFYECMAESYIPLLQIVSELWDEGIPAKLTIGITPILAEQIADPHLKAGFNEFIAARLKAAEKDVVRFAPEGKTPTPHLHYLAKFYRSWFQDIYKNYNERWNQDVIGAFKKFQDLGAVEITTSAATHCFSPLLSTDSSLHGQFKTGAEAYKRHFGRAPRGAWLPECAYRQAAGSRPAIEKWLHGEGIKYFFTESFAIQGGQTVELRRDFGPYRSIVYIPVPQRAATGLDTFEAYWLKDYPVAVMGRHEKAGFQVWSAAHGYPGDGNYREFHKKDDQSGLHYWKLTSTKTDLGDKMLYDPIPAMERINENSDHYVGVIQQALLEHKEATGKPGLVMVSFDTELFGHWWFEGMTFIKQVVKKMAQHTDVTMRTAAEYLEACPPREAIKLPESSWGNGGHWQVWLNDDTRWMWPIIHECEQTMEDLSRQYKDADGGLIGRALKQAARELLLVESSDWPFLVTTGQAKDYATERFNDHHSRFREVVDMIRTGKFDENRLAYIEEMDNCFPDISHTSFLPVETEVPVSA